MYTTMNITYACKCTGMPRVLVDQHFEIKEQNADQHFWALQLNYWCILQLTHGVTSCQPHAQGAHFSPD